MYISGESTLENLESTIEFTAIPTQNKSIVDIACGDKHVVMLSADNEVLVFGDNEYVEILHVEKH